MSYLPGKNFYTQVTTYNNSGISTNADIIPWSTTVRNGLDDLTVKTFVTNIDVGRYTISGVFPTSYLVGDSVGVAVSGLFSGNLVKYFMPLGVIDNAYVGNAVLGSGGLDNIFVEYNLVNVRQALTIALAALAGTSSGIGSTVWYQGINNTPQNRISSVANSGMRTLVSYLLP